MTYYVRTANKYRAKRTEFQGRRYDSKGEAGLAAEIQLLAKAGEVLKVVPQHTFPLYAKNGTKVSTHRPDFLLTFKDGHQEVWEYKGLALPIWQLKLKLFEDNYPDIIYYVITPRERFYGSKKRLTPPNFRRSLAA